MKKIIRKAVYSIIQLYFRFVFWTQVGGRGITRYYIFDIDNTLADTWPSYLVGYTSERERILSLSVFINMRKWVLQLRSKPQNKIIFITARSYASYLLTYKWLKSMSLPVSLFDLMVVEKPTDKINLLSRYTKKRKQFVMIDDLSYNHEKGEVKFYQKETERIKSMNIRYHGYQAILRYNGMV